MDTGPQKLYWAVNSGPEAVPYQRIFLRLFQLGNCSGYDMCLEYNV